MAHLSATAPRAIRVAAFLAAFAAAASAGEWPERAEPSRIAVLGEAAAHPGAEAYAAGWSFLKVPEGTDPRTFSRGLGAAWTSPVLTDDLGGPLLIQNALLIRFHSAAAPSEWRALLAKHGYDPGRAEPLAGSAHTFRIPARTSSALDLLADEQALASESIVEWAEADRLFTTAPQAIPNDPLFGDSWALRNTGQQGGLAGFDLGAERAWDRELGSPVIRAVILDVGIDGSHEDLSLAGGSNFTSEASNTGQPVTLCDNHGTYVAGTITGRYGNGLGTTGLAPGLQVASARIASAPTVSGCGSNPVTSSTWIVNALQWAKDTGSRMTVTPLDFGSSTAAVNDKYDELRAAGILNFAAAGNSNRASVGFPARLDSVLAIGAVNRTGVRAPFSSFGFDLSFTAPGEAISTTDRMGSLGADPGNYTTASGTSLAAGYAAAVAGLVWSYNRTLTADEVEAILAASARDLGTAGFDTQFGGGLLDAARALDITPEPPRVEVSPTSLTQTTFRSTVAAPVSFTVSNTGASNVNYTVNEGLAWAQPSRVSGTLSPGATDTITVTFDSIALPLGTYSGTITISDPLAEGSPANIAITLNVEPRPSPPTILAIPDEVVLNYRAGASSATPATFTLQNVGGGLLDYDIIPRDPWLTVTPSRGSIPVGQLEFITVEANTTGFVQSLIPTGLDIFATGATNSPTFINAALRRDDCAFTLDRFFADFGVGGGVIPFNVFANATCDWTVSGGPSWVKASRSEGVGPGLVTLEADANAGPARTATITIAEQTVTIAQAAGLDSQSVDALDPNDGFSTGAPLVTVGRRLSGLLLEGEDWFRVPVDSCEAVVIRAEFIQAEGDINLQVFDPRCSTGFPRIVGSAYGTLDGERVNVVDVTGINQQLYVRVYSDSGATFQRYALEVSEVGRDDAYEPNNTPCQFRNLPLGATYTDLILKDDDVFGLSTLGVQALDIDLEHDPLGGQLYVMVLEQDPSCGYRVIAGNFTPNERLLSLRNVPTGGAATTLVRVYAATRGTNFYNLSVRRAGEAAARVVDTTKLLPAPFDAAQDAKPFPARSSTFATDEFFQLNPGPCDTVRVNLDFSHAEGDLNLELYDFRCNTLSGQPQRVGESYSTTDRESIAYIDRTNVGGSLFARVYGEAGITNPNFTLSVDSLGGDDAFEENDFPCAATPFPMGGDVAELILRDDDFYVVNTAGLGFLTVEVEAPKFSGQLYFQILEDDSSCAYNVIEGFYEPNLDLMRLQDLPLNGRQSVRVRVYGASGETNVYRLKVEGR
ncbi:MAG: S8 family serine peptidase [Candidatus Sumerlaeia bacterium]|nr:S8 family serine peptidase [Candidatus Sumerlaeia bacterium]